MPGLDTAVGKSLNRFVHSRYFALCGGYGRPMARLPRSLLPDGIYHVTTRGVARTAIFLDDDDRRLFLSLLALAIRRYGWRCHAFCLMSNHYHLVVEATRAELSKGMQLLNGRYAELFNAKYRRSGHLFGDRFAPRLIQSDSHLAHACAYVLANPIRAGLCRHPGDWRWSGSPYERYEWPRRATASPSLAKSSGHDFDALSTLWRRVGLPIEHLAQRADRNLELCERGLAGRQSLEPEPRREQRHQGPV